MKGNVVLNTLIAAFVHTLVLIVYVANEIYSWSIDSIVLTSLILDCLIFIVFVLSEDKLDLGTKLVNILTLGIFVVVMYAENLFGVNRVINDNFHWLNVDIAFLVLIYSLMAAGTISSIEPMDVPFNMQITAATVFSSALALGLFVFRDFSPYTSYLMTTLYLWTAALMLVVVYTQLVIKQLKNIN